ncbi:MAG: hypothetical protein LBB54_00210 [Cellulomonadaceae bacterium]|jgi:alpha-glucosidase|nr:hypothetical protein [Cellulomonadaceae bacterium]
MTGINPQAALVGEHFFDYTHDLPGDGWQAAMNYAGFSRPVWGWLADPHSGLDFISVPLPRRRIPGRNIADTMRDFAARVPWQVASVQLNNLGSHDTPRLLNSVGTRENVELAAALLFTYPGVPMLFAGDEIGARGTNGEHARVTMPWDLAGLDGAGAAGSGSGTGTTGDSTGAGGGSRWDGQTLQVFRTLSRLRGSRQALRDGGIRWAVIDDDALVYLRQSRDETLLVVVARDSWGGVTLPSWVIPNGDATGPELLYGGSLIATPELSVTPGGIHISGDGPAVGIWRIA